MRASWFGATQGAQLVLIGSGGIDVCVRVAKQIGAYQRPGVRMFVDATPRLDVYKALGAKHGVLRTFTWTRWDNVVGLLRFPTQMFTFGALPTPSSAGDSFQQGATLVVARDGLVRFRLLEEAPGYPRLNHASLNRAIAGAVENVFVADSLRGAASSALKMAASAVLGALVAVAVTLAVR